MHYDDNNIFAKIIRGELDSDKVYEDEEFICIHDINPAASTHLLVIPKARYVSMQDFTEKASDKLIAGLFKTATKIAKSLGLEKNGYRLITNHGEDAEQSVKHLHIHILAGKPLGPLLGI